MIPVIKPRAKLSPATFADHTDSLEDALREGDLWSCYVLNERPSFALISNAHADDGLSYDELQGKYFECVEKFDINNDNIFSIYKASGCH